MILGTFKHNSLGEIISFELKGHASDNKFSKDIVCSAVSALSISTVNGIYTLAGVSLVLETADKGGYLYAEIPSSLRDEKMNITQILLKNLWLSLKQIQEKEKKFVQLRMVLKK